VELYRRRDDSDTLRADVRRGLDTLIGRRTYGRAEQTTSEHYLPLWGMKPTVLASHHKRASQGNSVSHVDRASHFFGVSQDKRASHGGLPRLQWTV
jgi:hypothetical protein